MGADLAEFIFSSSVYTALDHCPLLLATLPDHLRSQFRFETFWTKLPGFKETVKASWERPVVSCDKVWLLHVKLSRLSKALKRWSS